MSPLSQVYRRRITNRCASHVQQAQDERNDDNVRLKSKQKKNIQIFTNFRQRNCGRHNCHDTHIHFIGTPRKNITAQQLTQISQLEVGDRKCSCSRVRLVASSCRRLFEAQHSCRRLLLQAQRRTRATSVPVIAHIKNAFCCRPSVEREQRPLQSYTRLERFLLQAQRSTRTTSAPDIHTFRTPSVVGLAQNENNVCSSHTHICCRPSVEREQRLLQSYTHLERLLLQAQRSTRTTSAPVIHTFRTPSVVGLVQNEKNVCSSHAHIQNALCCRPCVEREKRLLQLYTHLELSLIHI